MSTVLGKRIIKSHVSFQEEKVTEEMAGNSSKALSLNPKTAQKLMVWVTQAQILLTAIALR